MRRSLRAMVAVALLAGGVACEGGLSLNDAPLGGSGSGPVFGGEGTPDPVRPHDPTAPAVDPIRPNEEFDCRDGVRDPGPALVRRLTVPEYVNTVQQALGVDIEEEAKSLLPADVRADGFTNTAYNLTVDLAHVDAYAQLAEAIVTRADLGAFVSEHGRCDAAGDEACVRGFVESAGQWLLRGPLLPAEVDAFVGVARAVDQENGDFDEAARYIVEAMLQSPRFLYRVEDQRGDGQIRQLTDWEVASRLSYLIWGGPPDEALHQAAAGGQLSTQAGIEAQVNRMLEDPRARQTSLRFAYDWLMLARQETLSPDPERFPDFSDELARDFNRETLAFVEHVLWEEQRPVGDLFSAQVTFATPRLARFYGLEPQGEGLQRYDLQGVPERGGLLTQASVLTAGGDGASMVARGLFVLHDVLCGHMEDPPPGVDVTPVPPMPGLSQRQIAEGRIADPKCGGCHRQFEPLAFGMERFDGIGGYSEQDHLGNDLRQDGNLPVPGAATDDVPSYGTVGELGQLLSASERVEEGLTLKVTQFALGRSLASSDACLLADVRQRMKEGGDTYGSLIAAIATSDLVRSTRTEQ